MGLRDFFSRLGETDEARAKRLGRELLSEIDRTTPDYEFIRQLIRNGADLRMTGNGHFELTPLMIAAAYHPALVHDLLDGGAPVLQKNKLGNTALITAAVHGQMKSIEELLWACGGAEGRKIAIETPNFSGVNALWAAHMNGKGEVYAFLNQTLALAQRDINNPPPPPGTDFSRGLDHPIETPPIPPLPKKPFHPGDKKPPQAPSSPRPTGV